MKDLLKSIFAGAVGSAIALGALLLILLLVFVALLPAAETEEVPDHAVLLVDLWAPVADGPVDVDPYGMLPLPLGSAAAYPLRLWEVTSTIRRAAEDERIVGLLFRGPVARSGLYSGWAALRELRGAVADFKKSGKPTYALCDLYGEAEYYLASAAEEVWVDPAGGLLLNGFSSERMYYTGAMEKLGIDVQVTRVGRYKSAVEPFMLERRSEADKEQTLLLLDGIESEFLGAASEGRGLERDALKAVLTAGELVLPADAEQRGLVTGSADTSELVDAVEKLCGGEAEGIGLLAYAEAVGPPEGGDSTIAVVYVEGEIVDGESSTQAGGATVARTLRKVAEDEDVSAVVLRVNSPGGSALASEVILREVLNLKAEKPVVVSMGSVAASGGYWISCRANRIFAEPNTVTGSIGVWGMLPNAAQLLEKVGLTVDTVKTSPHADWASMYRAKTDEEMAKIQVMVDRIYEDFLDRVTTGRGLERAEVAELAQGRVWSGTEAVRLGLVDELGGLDEAVAAAARLAALTDWELAFPQVDEPDLFDELVVALGGEPADPPLARGPLAAEVSGLLNSLSRLEQLGRPGDVQARLPYDLRIH